MPDAPLEMPDASNAPESTTQQEQQEQQEQPESQESTEPNTENEDKENTASQDRESKQSLSQQSKLRSSSFCRPSPPRDSTPDDAKQGALSTVAESPPEVFRRQTLRLEELERENKRLEKDMGNIRSKWNQADEELEESRALKAEVESLRSQVRHAEELSKETETLKEEIALLRRQSLQAAKRSSTSHPSSPHQPNPANLAGIKSPSPSSDSSALQNELKSKTLSIETMEMEISNLRARLDSQVDGSNLRIQNLESELSAAQATLETTTKDLESTKAAADSATKASNEAQIKELEAQLSKASTTTAEAENKVALLEVKISTLTNVHKESESRHQILLREKESLDKELHQLKEKLRGSENDNLQLREEVDHLRKRDVAGSSPTDGGHDDELLAQLEDEDRSRLQWRIRELEEEAFNLRRNLWREKRVDMQEGLTDPSAMEGFNYTQADLDDANLLGEAASKRRTTPSRRSAPKHSSFSTVLSSGIAAFTGTPLRENHPEQEGEDMMGDDFDEDAFANAQREAEERNRIERVREVKRELRDKWKGYRLNLVDARHGAQGAGLPLGDIFEA